MKKLRRVKVTPSATPAVMEKLTYFGWFHGWFQDHEESDEHGPANFPVAIVELDDGTIQTPYARFVQFVDPNAEGSL